MGLITKAVEKVEEKKAPSLEQEAPPQETPPPPAGKRRSGKKKLVTAVAALLFVGTSLGFGYFYLLGPSPETPPQVARRSISSRKEKVKPPASQVEERKEGASAMTSEETGASDQPAKESGTSAEQEERVSVPKGKPSAQTAEGTASKVKEGREVAGSLAEKNVPAEVSKKDVTAPQPRGEESLEDAQKMEISAPEEEPSAQITEGPAPPEQETPKTAESPKETDGALISEKDEKLQPDAAASESQTEDAWEDVVDEAMLPSSEESYSEEEVSDYLPELEREWSQPTLVVSERSDARAERYYQKGIKYHQQGELDKAIQFYQKAKSYNPEHLSAEVNLATAYLQRGRFKEAEQILVYLYALKPKDSRILFKLALLLYKTGEYSSAQVKLKKLLEQNPFHLEANLLLSSIHEERGEFDQAVEPLNKAYQINSSDPRVLYHLGRVWDMLGDPVQAARYYRLFLGSGLEKEEGLELAVRDRLKYLVSRKEER